MSLFCNFHFSYISDSVILEMFICNRLHQKFIYQKRLFKKSFSHFCCFSSTYQNVQMKSDAIWRYQQYHLTYEYNQRPCLPPPFSLLTNFYSIVKWFAKICLRWKRHGLRSVSKSFISFVALRTETFHWRIKI